MPKFSSKNSFHCQEKRWTMYYFRARGIIKVLNDGIKFSPSTASLYWAETAFLYTKIWTRISRYSHVPLGRSLRNIVITTDCREKRCSYTFRRKEHHREYNRTDKFKILRYLKQDSRYKLAVWRARKTFFCFFLLS